MYQLKTFQVTVSSVGQLREQDNETYRVDDALERAEAIFDGKHLVLRVCDIIELSGVTKEVGKQELLPI